MKLALAALLSLATLPAFASGSQDLYFTCSSPHAKIYVGVEVSDADGTAVTEVKFQGKTIESEIKSNGREGTSAPVTRLGFNWNKHVVALKTSKDVIDMSLNGGLAKLSVDGKIELMKCVP